ncbi:GIY-YIG nuclease family protein [Leptolyngbya ohadii]|uniref:GIY-YIG nuclease family protein n=1 Tax=Leptolyngbya ohadii TaxID=1962290 RepID=UPI001179A277|nr:GIY-YIG nuclease family protein [Leptolyngbya ohadii]
MGGPKLKEFEEIQSGSISGKLHGLTEDVKKCFQHGFINLLEALTDLKILAQMRRPLLLTLHCLEVQVDGQTLYKIGVTRREMDNRLAEIEAQLRQYFQTVKLKVKGTWLHRGNLELYFKHRYKSFHYPSANLTEYYQFDPDQIKDVLKDLKRLKPKVLSDLNLDKSILEGKPLLIERQIEAERQQYFAQAWQRQRSQSIRTGMERAKRWGKHVGRPVGAEETPGQFLAKPSSQRVMEALENGRSLRQAAAEAGVSVNTVRKVKAMASKH